MKPSGTGSEIPGRMSFRWTFPTFEIYSTDWQPGTRSRLEGGMSMKRLLATVFVGVLAAVSLTGCTIVSPLHGGLYTEVTAASFVGTAAGSSKKGEAKATSILGVALGDASLETAMKNGGITKVHHVDTKSRNILGVYGEYTVIVYGE
jgi:hypothetical protein